MPGIVGLITKMPREWAEPQLRQMVKTLHHESFYAIGTWIDVSLGVYLGWAVRKNSFSGGMPLRNEQGDVILAFSGEEFPDPGIAARLRLRGHTFEREGPSYLVHLYEDDPLFPAGLNGRFQGLVTDKRSGKTTLFNDRYGMHRIYYHESKEAFYFAAEAKAILSVRPELRQVDQYCLGEFVACGCVLENRTLFKGIRVLPPAAAWTFRDCAIDQKATYFQAREWEEQEPLDPERYYQELREVFSRNLPRYFQSQEQIGVSLTGGLDTRMIMAWHKARPGTLPCYSFGGTYRDCQDVVLARQVAEVCEQTHEVIPVGSEFLSRFAHYAERTVYLSDGCASVRCSSDLYANERAVGIAPVRMTGNFGSEILRRLPAFKPMEPAPGLFSPELLSHVQVAKGTYARLLEGHAVSFTAFRQAPWHHYGLLALEETQLSVRSPFLDNDLVRTAFRAPDSSMVKTDIFEDNKECVRLIADGNADLRRIRTDRGLAGSHGRISGSVSRALLEFAFRAEYAYDYGMPQWVARIDHCFSPLHLERLFLGRHKFNHFRVWYRDTLSAYVREILLDPRTLSRPYLNRRSVEALVSGHVKGNRNYTTEIHQLLTLELLHRLFLDPSAPVGRE
jgi:asparagine synthase (glutamine-hydrolysing)